MAANLGFDPMPETPQSELDQGLETLRANADRFARLPVSDYIKLVEAIRDRFYALSEEMVLAACKAKGLDPNSAVAGEEWLGVPMTILRNLRLLLMSLNGIEANGHPPLPKEVTLPTGQRGVRVLPLDVKDNLLFTGFTADIWLEPGQESGPLQSHMAEHYRTPPDKGYVSLILGAGNVGSIAPMDAFYKLFVERRVVIIKMNPVNEYLGPFIEKAMAPAIDEGFVRVVYGGAKVGSYLCYNEEVDDVHITGSNFTHDVIVWGPPGEEREERQRNNTPLLTKPISSELGNVSGVFIVPGPYSDSELRFVAENVASQLTNNGGFNCNAAKVLITAEGWDKADAFFNHLRAVFGEIPQRPAYYPGAEGRMEAFTAGREVETLGKSEGGVKTLPWSLIRGVDSTNPDDKCFGEEAFCSILAETTLPGSTPLAFLEKAVPFANDTLYGTLNTCFIVHPKTEKDPAFKAAFEQAICDLRFGTVTINHWAAIGYGLTSTPWGGHSGATLEDVQSGIGFVHNAFMFDRPQKSVIRGPLVVKPTPPWFRTNRNVHNVGRKLVDFEYKGQWWKVAGVALAAFKA